MHHGTPLTTVGEEDSKEHEQTANEAECTKCVLGLVGDVDICDSFCFGVTKFFPLAAVVTRSFDGQIASSVAEHVVLSLMRAPPREYANELPELES